MSILIVDAKTDINSISIPDLLPDPYALKFCRAGIGTVGDFVGLAEKYGLYKALKRGSDQPVVYYFGVGGPLGYGLGPKSWQALTSALDRLKVDWCKYIRNLKKPEQSVTTHHRPPGMYHFADGSKLMVEIVGGEPDSLDVYQPEVVRMAGKMAEVLQFYADRANWKPTRCNPGGLVPANSEVSDDLGKRARAILEEWEHVNP